MVVGGTCRHTGGVTRRPKDEAMPDFPPLTHLALTVRDLSVSVPWYEALFDAEPVLDEDTDADFHHTVYLLGNGTLLGLHQHRQAPPVTTFSEVSVGVDHVAFGCADRAELEKWARRPARPAPGGRRGRAGRPSGTWSGVTQRRGPGTGPCPPGPGGPPPESFPPRRRGDEPLMPATAPSTLDVPAVKARQQSIWSS